VCFFVAKVKWIGRMKGMKRKRICHGDLDLDLMDGWMMAILGVMVVLGPFYFFT